MELPRVGQHVPARMEHSAHVQPPCVFSPFLNLYFLQLQCFSSGSYSDPLSALVSTSRSLPSSQPHRATAANALPPGLSIQRLNHERKTAEDQKFRFYREVRQALEKLQHGCAACWGRGLPDWARHVRESCPHAIARVGEERHAAAAPGRLLLGLFSPQGALTPFHGTPNLNRYQDREKKIHPWLEDLGNCPLKDIVKAAIYAWATKPADNIRIQLMVPAEATDGATFDALWEWLLRIDPDSPGEITNLLILFMKLVATRKLL